MVADAQRTPVHLDAGDWIAIACAAGGGVLALVALGADSAGLGAIWFCLGLAGGAGLATAALSLLGS